MSIRLRPPDTIAWRIALTVGAAIIGVLGLAVLFSQLAGPTARETALLDRADDTVRMIDAASAIDRPRLARAVQIESNRAEWYAANSTVARRLAVAQPPDADSDLSRWFLIEGRQRPRVFFSSDDPLSAGIQFDRGQHSRAYFLAVELRDESWVVFIATQRDWGLLQPRQIAVALGCVGLSILAASVLATYFLSKPIRQFADELRRIGGDPRAGPVRETGPGELRAAIAAFNALQAQVRKFVEDRTVMLAAMSHDLRTPLTKIRLRGEFIEDDEQRARLFRDVDDLQAMADSALSFFRDDYKDEETTVFDFAGLLRTITDDYGDQGQPVSYAGPDRLAFNGRPFSLRRACMNLVDNALKYGNRAELQLNHSATEIVVEISDRGAGIPPHALEQVFAPFFRLEQSRNRSTGGMGLGLTSARAVIRAHGGDIALRNRECGGLQVSVTLPLIS
ncbi:sensor histidine kinase [Paraburkholderia sp. 22099]|jgi:signal transduction histidine kinase|uniref:sensor histidine kinase n=1 Tax=Paraburkholderia TaxID=1822464 RepID=UPI00285C7F23|nr:ATP-binding protein [Paraburkholderia terricola]MDR6495337.1 signal transduction histidine kinase [Paraburkholderia terricola]